MFRIFQKSAGQQGQTDYRVAPWVRATAHEKGLVLLDTGRGVVLTANTVGARIWEGLSRGETLSAIARTIAREFVVAESVVRADADRFVRELRAEGLVVAA
jgi:hypothetical protein